jgi:hypothetical protein
MTEPLAEIPGTAASAADRPAIDTSVAHSARVHDYWLGGKDNYAADRAAGGVEAFGRGGGVEANRAW